MKKSSSLTSIKIPEEVRAKLKHDNISLQDFMNNIFDKYMSFDNNPELVELKEKINKAQKQYDLIVFEEFSKLFADIKEKEKRQLKIFPPKTHKCCGSKNDAYGKPTKCTGWVLKGYLIDGKAYHIDCIPQEKEDG